MSTRCQIVIQAAMHKPVKVTSIEVQYEGIDHIDHIYHEAEITGAYPHYIYKHSDGYPTGVLPVLVPFVKAFSANRGHDLEYCVAQVIRAFAFADFEHHRAMDVKDAEIFEEESKAHHNDPKKHDAPHPTGAHSGDNRGRISWEQWCKESPTGWGIDTVIHGDIEWLYVVNPGKGTVTTYSGENWKRVRPKFGAKLYQKVA